MAVVGVVAAALVSCGNDSGSRTALEGNGEIVTEVTTVSEFSRVRISNGVDMALEVDEEATGEIEVAVTTDSNLIEFVSVSEADGTLAVSVQQAGGVRPTEGFDVTATVAGIREADIDNRSSISVEGPLSGTAVSVKNGSEAKLVGTAHDVSLTALTGSLLDAGRLEVVSAEVLASKDSSMTVCASANVYGAANYGSTLTVLCGADTGGVTTSVGSTVSTGP